MAITQISKIQIRRGLAQDLPNLSSGEMAWSTDTQELWIGNGSDTGEHSPNPGGKTLIYTTPVVANLVAISANVTANSANIAILQTEVNALGGSPINVSYGSSTSGIVTTTTANNATISYTLTQGTKQRTGSFRMSYVKSAGVVSFDEEYDEANGTTDIVFTANASTTNANILYTTTTATSVRYLITTV